MSAAAQTESLATAVEVELMALGGSIESVLARDGSKSVVSSIEALVHKAVPDGFAVSVNRIACIPSFSLRLDDILLLAARIAELPETTTPLVTCGTDLLEEVAFLLDCLAPPQGTVLAATFTHGESPVARQSLESAFRVVASPTRPNGIAVAAVDGVLYSGRRLDESELKLGAYVPAAGLSSCLGRSAATDVSWTRCPAPLVLPSDIRTGRRRELPTIAIANATLTTGSRLAQRDMLTVDVLVTHGFGAGNLPPDLAELAQRRLAGGKPVVVCASSWNMGVEAVSHASGGVGQLLAAGAWNARTLTPRKSVALIGLVVDHTDPGAAETVFRTVANQVAVG